MKTNELVEFIKGSTNVLAVLGNPIGHSISPQIHNTLSKILKNDIAYVAFEVKKGYLEDAVNGLRALNVKGFNVTIPFKQDVMKLTDHNSSDAVMIGAVN